MRHCPSSGAGDRHWIRLCREFGTGYSSRRHLQQFPSNLEDDQSFVETALNVAEPQARRWCFDHRMAQSLGIHVIAEGISKTKEAPTPERSSSIWGLRRPRATCWQALSTIKQVPPYEATLGTSTPV